MYGVKIGLRSSVALRCLAACTLGALVAGCSSDVTGAPLASNDGRTVTLAPGETLDTISVRYSVPRKALMDVNGLRDAGEARPGRQLLIPTYSASRGGWVAPEGTSQQAYGQSQQPSYQQSSRQASLPAPGASQQSAPRQTPSRSAQAGGGRHKVEPGETVYSIGRAYNVSPSAIIAANNFDDPNNVRIGSTIVIPGAGGQQVASQAPVQQGTPPQTMQQQAAATSSQLTAPVQNQTLPPAQELAAAAPASQNTQVAMAPTSGESANDAGPAIAWVLAGGTFRLCRQRA